MSTLSYYCLAGFCIKATLAPFLPSDKWYVRGFEFPHAQICFITLVVLVVGLLYIPFTPINLSTIFSLLGCFIYQFVIIYPYTPLSRKQVLSCDREYHGIKLLSCNVFMDNRKVDKLLTLVNDYDPDLFLLIETNVWWQQAIQSLEKQYPFRVSCPLENTYGMILYSKLELLDPEVTFLVEPDVPSIHASVKIGDQRVRLHCMHPAPPSPTENKSAIERDAELMMVAKKMMSKTDPQIVIGDLNDVAWSSTTRLFQKISGLLDPRIGRGFFNTFHVSFPFLRWPLDHIFHSNHFKVKRIKRGPNIGSDHFPIFIELCYHPAVPLQQEEPQAQEDELELADEKIEQAFEN